MNRLHILDAGQKRAARPLWRIVACLAGWGLACSPLFAGTLQLSGGGVGTFNIAVTSVREARFQATTHQQYDYSCGSAAVATLLRYHYDHPVTEQAVFEEMFRFGNQDTIRKQGFSLLDIKSYLARHGFEADAFGLPLQALVDAHVPALVLLSEKGYNHFVVVKGVRQGRVLMGDPSSGTRALSITQFESVWPSKLLFVIHSRHAQVRFNNPADWQAAPLAPLALGLEAAGLSSLPWPKLGPGDY